MDALGSGSLLICEAGGYVREGSFHLDVNADHFLYESTTKRKIEDNTQKK